jgi:putative membrane protein
MMLISFIGVAALPMLYSGTLTAGSWDPYGHLGNLPVAVVNLDKGAVYEGKTMDVGSEFESELKKNGDFKWIFVSGSEAKDGMAHNKYYMTVTIPEDFSKKATTLMDEHPQQAEIIFEPNSDYNFVGGQIGSSAIKDLRAKLSEKITEAYTQSMFDQLEQISDGFGQASDGANKLTDGAGKLEDGIATLKANLGKLADGTAQLQRGLKPLSEGAAALHQGTTAVSGGASDLSAGLNALSAAERKLESGAAQAQQGSAQLQQGLQASKAASAKLTAGLAASAESSSKLADGAAQVEQGLEQLVQSNPQLEASPQVQQLLAASKAVAQGSAQLKEGQQQLLAGSSQLDEGQQQLLQGADKLNQGQQQLAGGLQQFGAKLSDAAAGGSKLAAGASKADQGAAKLQSGLARLSEGVSSLADGSGKLDDGAGQLQNGALKLVDGSQQLAGKLSDAASKTSEVKTGDATVSMFADPVKITDNNDRKLNNYGLGIAPYFLSLALFIGGLVLTTVFPVRESTVPNASRMGRFVSKTLTFATMSVLQSVGAGLILLYGIGVEVKSVPLFFLFTLAASMTFTLIIQALVTWLDNPGRFLAIVLMILQLTSSAGTFPLELLPGWMQKLNPWLPMTHSILGFKAIIATGDFAFMWEQMRDLAFYAAVALALTFAYYIRHKINLPRKAAQEVTA